MPRTSPSGAAFPRTISTRPRTSRRGAFANTALQCPTIANNRNLLTSASGGVALGYDPALRLYQTVGAATTRFAYDGLDAIAEYNGAGALQRRFVFDPTTHQPVVWFEGTGVAATNARYLSQDERGSVISVSAN